MVWLSWATPSLLSDWVQAREREPSRELPLVSDAVRERASRVMLAEGTAGRWRERERTGKKEKGGWTVEEGWKE